MWFLGAGASASAGVPTATDLAWEFKQRLFISQRRVSPQTVADLSNANVRNQLQAHIDSSGLLPKAGDKDEYAALFEAVFPAEADRRAYLDSKLVVARPSYGHLALAAMMRAGHARLVWTTNFDTLVADACAKVFDSTSALSTVTLEVPGQAKHLVDEGRWPIEVKLHGDFRSRRLKNTGEELREQDARLRHLMIEACRRFGLLVVGYSGRDDSIMNTLEEALEDAGAFPSGLFWLHRGEDSPAPEVARLLAKATEKGVEAELVSIENFDETLRDLIRLLSGVDLGPLEGFAAERRRWSAAPRPVGRHGWPVIRLNAVPVVRIPSVCRRVACQIGGAREAREAVRLAGVDLLVARTRAGVLAFGSDDNVRGVFSPFGIQEFDLHTIEPKKLRHESGERGLLRDALTHAIARQRGLDAIRRRSADLLAPADPEQAIWEPLKRVVGSLQGRVKSFPELRWREGVGVRLDWADDRLWLLLDPRTVFDGLTEVNAEAAADFARERSVKRYNRQLNDLVAFWGRLLAADGSELRALGVEDGVDAGFMLSAETGFSWRTQA